MTTPTLNSGNALNPLGFRDNIDTSQSLEIGIAWGWYLLLAISIILLVLIIIYFFKTHQKRAYKHYFKTQFTQLEQSENIVIDLSLYLRKFASIQFNDKNITALSGTDWIKFLDSKKPLSNTLKHQLQIQAYQDKKVPYEAQEVQELVIYVKEFVRV